MKTKVIEHEWVTIDPTDGDKDTDYLIAVRPPQAQYENTDGTVGHSFKRAWEINGTDLQVYGADEAREYIKLFEKIIEAEESED